MVVRFFATARCRDKTAGEKSSRTTLFRIFLAPGEAFLYFAACVLCHKGCRLNQGGCVNHESTLSCSAGQCTASLCTQQRRFPAWSEEGPQCPPCRSGFAPWAAGRRILRRVFGRLGGAPSRPIQPAAFEPPWEALCRQGPGEPVVFMAVEIERKFLPAGDGWRGLAAGTHYVQGYLAADRACTVRVRLAGASAFLTVKGHGDALARPEFEYPIPATDAAQLLDLCPLPLVGFLQGFFPVSICF